ncbi:MAG: DUF5317 family protein [Armatimonadota bacterium]|nr:DUF5317 family protein [Armatimonadota bacterium]MDR7439136.1 DUF5317 family protein [Armatimonadota bacterium]MDR7562143.1 DUF5317 family protein [Armatimonadota bacterium]MDR7567617.1 DUF5317 family protein [Armatimonadota bacterium]
MLLLLPLALSLCVGWIRGGSLRKLAEAQLRLPWVAILAILVQVAIFDPTSRLVPVRLPTVPVHILSYLLLAVFIGANRRLPGMWLLAAGFLANTAVILSNGGYMPASEEALRAAGRWSLLEEAAGTYNNSSLIGPQTRLWFLADVFAIPAGLPFANVFSLGDVLLALGILLLVPALMGARPLWPEVQLAAAVAGGLLVGYLLGTLEAPAALSVARPLQPSPTPHPVQKPSPLPSLPAARSVSPPHAPQTLYTVQVGAYRDPANARAMVRRLMGDGYSARILSGSLYRVVVGEFETEERAQRLAALLSRSGYPTYVRRLP